MLYRMLPSVDEVLRGSASAVLMEVHGRMAVTHAARAVLGRLRVEIAAGTQGEESLADVLRDMAAALEREVREAILPSLVPVLNATGVVLHTNLGRAPLSRAALDEIVRVAGGYSNLEFGLETGERGRRDQHAEPMLLQTLAAMTEKPLEQFAQRWSVAVVNNCAAATFLALNSIAEGGEVLVSRGELVEIGGGFRIPEILRKAGVVLREVGTTNRTRIADYASALTANTRMILRVHPSNFRMEGFTAKAELAELIALGERAGVPVFEDQGTGSLLSPEELEANDESSLLRSVREGPALIAASGDKLMGGPQCGILLGEPKLLEAIRANPLFRVLRVDKLTYAALGATLRSYATQTEDDIPTVRMLRMKPEVIRARCAAVAEAIRGDGIEASVVPVQSVMGGGTTAGTTLSSFAVEMHCGVGASVLLAELRRQTPPVIARVQHERVLLDLRTVAPEQDTLLVELLHDAVRGLSA